MIDYARITVKAGNGGSGSGSFFKIKGKRFGKADGGDGGSGGNVYIEATGDLLTLEKYRFVKDYKAQNGESGLSRRRRGAGGEDLVLKVPVGTVIKIENLKLKKSRLLSQSENFYDLAEDGQKVLVARGGEGGRGNAHLKDEFGRRPRVGEKGEEGELLNITLELKLLADVGLMGLPNAGKSTLLARLTRAKPKIADYPFTTLEPNLGVLSLTANRLQQTAKISEQNAVSRKRLIIADIPGLIEGASRGKGLGDLFLRHIERTRILVHLIDITGRDLWQDYKTVRQELKDYSRELLGKKEIIVLTKTDLVPEAVVSASLAVFRKKRKKVLAISALTGEGLSLLVELLAKL